MVNSSLYNQHKKVVYHLHLLRMRIPYFQNPKRVKVGVLFSYFERHQKVRKGE